MLVCVVHGLQFENCFRGGELRYFCFPVCSCGSAAVEDLPVNCVCQEIGIRLLSALLQVAVLETSAFQGGIACSRDSS